MTPRALTSQGTAAASEGQEAAAVTTADRIVGDETLEKVRAWQDINKIGLLVRRNPEKMTALLVLKKLKANPQKKIQKAVTETVTPFREHDDEHASISEAQIIRKMLQSK